MKGEREGGRRGRKVTRKGVNRNLIQGQNRQSRSCAAAAAACKSGSSLTRPFTLSLSLAERTLKPVRRKETVALAAVGI